MSRLIRIAIGLALFAGGLTFLAYGIAQAIENGNCGTDKYGREVGPPCPTGFGPMIALMVLGAFVAFGGAALASRRGSVPGMAVLGGMLRFFGATALAAIGAAVLGIVDVHPDDTRPGVEIVWLVSGEANPEPVGAGPDSLLRSANLKRVLDASRGKTSGNARVSGLDVHPDSVALTIQNGSRTLTLRYGYDAQLTSRDISPSNGATEETVALDDIDPAGPERLAKASRRAGSKGLRDVQYVLLEATARGDGRPGLLLYLPPGSDPPYVVGDLHGRRLSWPGRS